VNGEEEEKSKITSYSHRWSFREIISFMFDLTRRIVSPMSATYIHSLIGASTALTGRESRSQPNAIQSDFHVFTTSTLTMKPINRNTSTPHFFNKLHILMWCFLAVPFLYDTKLRGKIQPYGLMRPWPSPRLVVPDAQPLLSPVACFCPPPSLSPHHQLKKKNLSVSAQPSENRPYSPMHLIFHVGAWAVPHCTAFHLIWTSSCIAVRWNIARNAPVTSELFEGLLGGDELPVGAPLDGRLEVEPEFRSTNGWIQALTLE
jgi:hypothetical protein